MTTQSSPARVLSRDRCPRCKRPTIMKRDGIFHWRACPAAKSCGWTVFTHGDDPRDRATS